MPTVPSTNAPGVTTGTIASQRIFLFRADEIIEVDPIKRALLFMLNGMGQKVVPGPKNEWQVEDRAQIMTGVNGAAVWSGLADGATVTLTVDEASIFKINHTVYALTNTGDAGNFRARVTAVDETNNQISLELVTDGTNIAGVNIANNADLIQFGSSYPEFSSRPDPMSVQPTLIYNYTQHFRDTWSAGDYMMSTDLYGDPEFQRLSKRAVLKQAQDLENSIWWGIRRVNSPVGGNTHEGRLSNANQPRWMSGGVFYALATHSFQLAADLNAWVYSDLVGELQGPAEYVPGSTWMMFCGPDVISRISTPGFMLAAGAVAGSAVTHEREALSDVFGFNIKRLTTPHGDAILIPSYETFHNRTAAAGGGVSQLDIKAVALLLDNMSLVTIPDNPKTRGGLLNIEANIESPGDHGRIDGVYSYMGLEWGAEQHHAEWLFSQMI